MRALPLAVLISLSPASAFPSFSTVLPWPGPERATDILERGDGSILVLGMRSAAYGVPSDLLLVELDPLGDTIRTVILGGPESEIPGGLTSTGDGGLLIAYTASWAGPDSIQARVLRLDSALDTVWCTPIADGRRGALNGLAAVPGGGCVVAGCILPPGDPAVPLGLAALLDASGDTLWTVSIPGPGPAVFAGVDAGYAGPVFCGTVAHDAGTAVWLAGTNWTGTVVLDVRLAAGPCSEGTAVAVAEGGILVAGSASGDHEGVAAMYLAFVDGVSSAAWERTYGGLSWERAEALCEAGEGWLLAGTSRSSAGDEADRSDLALVRTDADGGMLWTRRHGTPSPDYGWGISPSAGGGFLVAGSVTDFAGGSDYDAWILRVDSLGNLPGLGHGAHAPGAGAFSAVLLGNPCTDSVGLRLRLPAPAALEVRLFDLFGRRVGGPLRAGPLAAGEQELRLPLEDLGGPLPSGIYLLHAACGGERLVLAVTVLRGGSR